MHVQGQDRYQATLFPERLDELIGEDNPVRVIDAFVDSLQLKALGFARIEVKATGWPPYHPGDLLKLYVYGYMHRIRSCRALERECHTNLEVLWLLNRLGPRSQDDRQLPGGQPGSAHARVPGVRAVLPLTGTVRR
jgi:transposase